ncbi:7333_t:CDS:2 [Dentiscutata heterogama]|uniref:7333_t:CDS:1 n=1 Tax=Dentiscutata heterogama TaxID=1316150 RepID=A0ACA9K4N0_9GLOM|nr:7333_t:CDS:2 [Dentiscutata heterogama]
MPVSQQPRSISTLKADCFNYEHNKRHNYHKEDILIHCLLPRASIKQLKEICKTAFDLSQRSRINTSAIKFMFLREEITKLSSNALFSFEVSFLDPMTLSSYQDGDIELSSFIYIDDNDEQVGEFTLDNSTHYLPRYNKMGLILKEIEKLS